MLRGELCFNGVVITDATQMIGFNVAHPREKAIPGAIAAGFVI
jgi:beta-N-acetylhexosaminidase